MLDEKRMWSFWQQGQNLQVNASGTICGSLWLWREAWKKREVRAPPHLDLKWLLTLSFLCFLEAIKQSWCASALLFHSRLDSVCFVEGMNLLRWPQTSLMMTPKKPLRGWGAGRRLGALLLCDCFCFSGSNVSYNQLGMRVYLAKLWSGVFRATADVSACFQKPRGKNYWKDKCYLSTCEEQLSFHELVTLWDLFRVALWSTEAQSVSSCWISAHLARRDPWNIKKKSFMISR